jgi:hypothetical protein
MTDPEPQTLSHQDRGRQHMLAGMWRIMEKRGMVDGWV